MYHLPLLAHFGEGFDALLRGACVASTVSKYDFTLIRLSTFMVDCLDILFTIPCPRRW